jgi:hypothetical protein
MGLKAHLATCLPQVDEHNWSQEWKRRNRTSKQKRVRAEFEWV